MNTHLTSLFRVILISLSMALPAIAKAIAPEPNIQTIILFANAGSCNEIDINLLAGDGSRRLIVACAGSPVSQLPVDGTGYNGGSIFGTGSDLGNGNFVIYSGSGTSMTVSGLDGGTEYYFACFEFNGTGGNSNYLTSTYPEANAIAPGIALTVLSSSGDICIGDTVELQASGGVSYSWTPSAGLSSSTAPIVTAAPNNTTTYTVTGTDNNGCQDSKTLTVVVNQLPLVTLSSFPPACINEGLVVLGGGNPAGGTYFGAGVSSGLLDPTIPGAGNTEVFYTYTDIHGCIDTASRNMQIKNAPTVSLTTPSSVCIDDAPFFLSNATPGGGDYYGDGVDINGNFDPNDAGVGTFIISYVYSAQGCSDTASDALTVYPQPVVHFSTQTPVCVNTVPYTLAGGSPAGGIYSGTAVNGNEFDPATAGIGNFIITYGYTDSHGCYSSDTSVVRVNGLPTVSLSTLPNVCQNTGPVALNQGSPAGGAYTGTGVGGTTFYTGIAGAGVHQITYTYHDANNCYNSASQNITVNPIPPVNLGPDTTICVTGSVVLNGGSFTSYSWSTGQNTPSITFDSTGRGEGTFRVILLASNVYSCTNRDTIFVTIDACNGIEENNAIEFSAYPNPFTSGITVKTDSYFEVFLYDISGKLIMSRKNNFLKTEIGETLSTGTYLLKVKTSEGQSSLILVKE